MIKAIALLTPIYVTSFWSFAFLIQKGERNRSKMYLGFFMLLAFMLYCTHAIFFSQLYKLYSYFESLYLFTMLSVYPLYYIYILLRTNENAGFKPQILHFLPAFVFSFLSLVTTFFLSPEQRIFYVQDVLIDKNLKEINFSSAVGVKGFIFFIARLIFLVQIIYYAFSGVKRVNIHNRIVANFYSNIEGKTLNWIRYLNIVILFVAIASICFVFIGRSYFTRHEVSLLIPSFIFSSLLFVIGFKGNQQTEILEKIREDKDLDIEFEEIKTAHEDKLKTNLIDLFENSKIYIQPDLRITVVSELIRTNRTYISRLINDEFDMNFNEFVNKYRIEEAKQLLCCKNHTAFTMEHIAEKSGFGSTASFSRVFKEVEGTTPGKYRSENKKGFNRSL